VIILEKRYNPKNVENKWYSFWEEHGYFHARVRPGQKPYVIVIPPPNITGILTMGHVLNNTLQDILVRWRRMQGLEVLWLPGTDHAGIATQNVVEKELAKQGTKKEDLGREGFLKKVWEWKGQYGSTIIRQLKKLGCSCDWGRERFTMDEGLSRAVREVFLQLHERGLIYKGSYIINWCPRCHTALSDEEVEHEDHEGHLWHIRYPFKSGAGYVSVATTRPETMLGDTAVAVHPGDGRYKDVVGKTVVVPVVQREIPVIADDFVNPKFGTGIVKVTPAHDPNDFLIAQRHGLERIVVMDGNAVMNSNAGPNYEGMDRFECREALVNNLARHKLLGKTKKYQLSVGHCYRCRTVIEPYLSEQWFVKMGPLSGPALKAVKKGRIKFFPERWIKVYQNWMENIRDWCISRQLWWGHRIPVWYCTACGKEIFSRETPLSCPRCGKGELRQDENVLDTWFSSWLWPFSTLGWPERTEDLNYFYPTTCLVTGPDIIFFWVARMIMAGLEFMKEIPFEHVFFTGIIRDREGRKMSKSLGNSPDPLDVIESYGADALRFTIARLSPLGQDIYYSNESCELGRNFANKIWNASRFILMNVGEVEGFSENRAFSYTADDLYILSKLNQAVIDVTGALESYRFNDAAKCLYDFFWRRYCDWYIELVKPLIQREKDEHARRSCYVLLHCLEKFLRLLSPFMPFLSEEIWQMLPPLEGQRAESVTMSSWPHPDESMIDQVLVERTEKKFEVIRVVRKMRKEYDIPQKVQVSVVVKPASAEEQELIEESRNVCMRLMRASELRIDSRITPTSKMVADATSSGTVAYIELEDEAVVTDKIEGLRKEIEEIDRGVEKVDRQLSNQDFVKKAPPEIVERSRRRRKELAEKREKVRINLEQLMEQ
jgi:valyl-tRNA synthetase